MAVPGEVVEAAVRVCGRAFHYKDQLRSVLVAAGVPGDLYDKWNVEGASKYVVSRHVLTDLAGRGPAGQDVVRRVVTDLANMTAPDDAAPDQDAGRQAIRDLRALATARRVLIDPESAASNARREGQDKRLAAETARRRDLEALSQRLVGLTQSTDNPQRRGYALERLLADLFTVCELSYRPSYKIAHEQIDGAFDYRSFTYLVEARWRATTPGFGDLADFKAKVDGKIESTRGLFLSMAGFDEAVVDHFMGTARGTRQNLVLVDGQDLALIVQGTVSLTDALDYKIAAASQEGVWWAPLAARH